MINYLGNCQLFSTANNINYTNSNTIYTKLAELLETKNTYINYDLETSGLNCFQDKILLVSFGLENDQIVIPGNYKEVIQTCFNKIKESGKILLAHNAKFDYKFTKLNYDIKDIGFECLMLTHKVVHMGKEDEFPSSLEGLYLQYYKEALPKTERRNFIGKQTYNFTEKEIIYAAKDVEKLHLLYQSVYEDILKYNLVNVLTLEQKDLIAYAEMELNGIYLNKQYWKTEVIDYYKKLSDELEEELNRQLISLAPQYENKNKSQDMFTGETYYFKVGKGKKPEPASSSHMDWNSTKELEIMFNKVLNIDLKENLGYEMSLTGMDSLARYCHPLFIDIKDKGIEKQMSVLEEIKTQKGNNFIETLYCYKQVQKYNNSFGEKFLEHIESKTGRVHTDIFQLGTETGRVSSNKPNMQQIPKINRFRQAFQAREGYSLLTADYSGAELRIIAEGSQDPTMIQAFINNEDLHSKMASIMFNTEVSKKVNEYLRTRTKTIVFGLAYGAGPQKFAPSFDGDINKAKDAVNKFFSSFPLIKNFLDRLGDFATNNFYSVTFNPFNRIRWYEEPKHYVENEERKQLSAIKRAGMNHPIQGTCADIVKLATWMIHDYIKKEKLDAFIVNQVHDEVVIEFNHSLIEPIGFGEKVREIMLQAGKYIIKSIPMEVEYKISSTWEK